MSDDGGLRVSSLGLATKARNTTPRKWLCKVAGRDIVAAMGTYEMLAPFGTRVSSGTAGGMPFAMRTKWRRPNGATRRCGRDTRVRARRARIRVRGLAQGPTSQHAQLS